MKFKLLNWVLLFKIEILWNIEKKQEKISPKGSLRWKPAEIRSGWAKSRWNRLRSQITRNPSKSRQSNHQNERIYRESQFKTRLERPNEKTPSRTPNVGHQLAQLHGDQRSFRSVRVTANSWSWLMASPVSLPISLWCACGFDYFRRVFEAFEVACVRHRELSTFDGDISPKHVCLCP